MAIAASFPTVRARAISFWGQLAAPAAIVVDTENSTPQSLPFIFNYTDPGMISANDNWSAVPGIEGYIMRNDAVATTGVDPRTILGNTFGAGTTTIELDVTANQPSTAASTATFGGLAEFHEAPQGGPFPFPIFAMQPDNTADAVFLLVNVNTTGRQNIHVQYAAHDIDCSTDDSVQLVATQYRIGNTGNFTNVPDEFIHDVTFGNDCTTVSIMGGDLPPAANNQPLVQFRIITTNATGADEWVGIELFQITGTGGGTPTPTSTPTHTPTNTPTNTPTATPTPASVLMINEIDSDQMGNDTVEFVELYDGGVGNTLLTGNILVFYDGANDQSYLSLDLDGFSTNSSGYFTIGNAGVRGVDLIIGNGVMQNGADAVAVYNRDANLPNGTPVTTLNLRDAIIYDTTDPDDAGLMPLILSGGQADENEGGTGTRAALQRCPNGSGGTRSTLAFRPRVPTPDAVNTCQLALNSDFDFDGDGKTDIGVFRPSSGVWYVNQSAASEFILQLGSSGDKLAPADFDGDGRTDHAVYRPSQGVWYIYNSSTSTYTATQFGLAQDIPIPGDFDGDDRADIALFRPSDGTWYIQQSATGVARYEQFGSNGDVPISGDFDGDGVKDLSLWRSSNGVWYSRRSLRGDFAIQFGSPTDTVAPGDYDGDGTTDVGIYRRSTGAWYSLYSSNSTYPVQIFGLSGDTPTVGDYDGDGRDDIGVFRPSDRTWYLNRTTGGLFITQYGLGTDKPVPSAFGN